MQGQHFVVMPPYNACFWNLLIAALDPINRVQPRSRTTCVGWLDKFKGIAAIHAVTLEYQSSDSQEWPYPSTLGDSGEESPD